MHQIADAQFITMHRGSIIVLCHFLRRAFVLEALFKGDEGTIQAQRERHDNTFRTKGTRKFNS